MGKIARLSKVDRRLFQNFDADSISEALSSAIKHITVIMLTSDIPVRENALTIADVVLNVLVVLKILLAAIVLETALVVLIVLDSVLSIDDNNLPPSN